MQYKVLPYTSNISIGLGQNEAANQLAAFIEKETSNGWEFVSCGNISTQVSGSNGCFGFGATPEKTISTMVMVFRK